MSKPSNLEKVFDKRTLKMDRLNTWLNGKIKHQLVGNQLLI